VEVINLGVLKSLFADREENIKDLDNIPCSGPCDSYGVCSNCSATSMGIVALEQTALLIEEVEALRRKALKGET